MSSARGIYTDIQSMIISIIHAFENLYYIFKLRNILLQCMVTYRASLVAQRLKHLPGMRETWVQSLGREDSLEKEMATHSSTLAWKIPWMEETRRLESMGLQRIQHD